VLPQVGLQRKCKVYGKLILRKIIETVATRCHIWNLKCTKFDLGWGSAPDPTGGAYSTLNPPAGSAGFKGAYFYWKEGMEGKGEKGWEREVRDGRGREHRGREGKEGEGTRTSEHSPSSKFATTPLVSTIWSIW